MNFFEFISDVFAKLNNLEVKIQSNFKFSTIEMAEIMRCAKRENLRFLESLVKINKLTAFEISFLLSSVSLDEAKVEIIEKATKMYNDEEFTAQGQTFADFIFRVAANIDYLNNTNLELFRELVQCQNEVYDFTQILKNPMKYRKHCVREIEFAFEKVLY
jgi:hypothetical protein